MLLVAGFGLVGLVDDIIGTSAARGFRGHLGALRSGRLTSGLLKLALGLAIAAVATLTDEGLVVHGLRAVVIVGSANVFNLLDLAPGRAVKSAVVLMAPVIVLERAHEYFVVGPIMFLGAVLGLAPFEMREEVMLGDAGSNALGAAVGSAWVVAVAGNDVALGCLAAVVLGINVAGEFTSFSRVIDRVGPLRAFDRWGRRP